MKWSILFSASQSQGLRVHPHTQAQSLAQHTGRHSMAAGIELTPFSQLSYLASLEF